tara:strand:- start:760 stop:1035 length:276 start_codon:yes stop_codon:yes gene_type:complete
MDFIKRKWLLYSIGGLIVCSSGLCLIGEAIIFKISNDFNWFYIGTLSLIVFNSGICLVAEATILLIQIRNNKKESLDKAIAYEEKQDIKIL